MSLKRKDCRFYLDPDVHAALQVKCESTGVDLAEYVEKLVAADVTAWVTQTSVAADKLHRRGIVRSAAEFHGETRKGGK